MPGPALPTPCLLHASALGRGHTCLALPDSDGSPGAQVLSWGLKVIVLPGPIEGAPALQETGTKTIKEGVLAEHWEAAGRRPGRRHGRTGFSSEGALDLMEKVRGGPRNLPLSQMSQGFLVVMAQ